MDRSKPGTVRRSSVAKKKKSIVLEHEDQTYRFRTSDQSCDQKCRLDIGKQSVGIQGTCGRAQALRHRLPGSDDQPSPSPSCTLPVGLGTRVRRDWRMGLGARQPFGAWRLRCAAYAHTQRTRRARDAAKDELPVSRGPLLGLTCCT